MNPFHLVVQTLGFTSNALFKLLYLRCTELAKKWEGGHIQNWSMVLNQLMMNECFAPRINKYIWISISLRY